MPVRSRGAVGERRGPGGTSCQSELISLKLNLKKYSASATGFISRAVLWDGRGEGDLRRVICYCYPIRCCTKAAEDANRFPVDNSMVTLFWELQRGSLWKKEVKRQVSRTGVLLLQLFFFTSNTCHSLLLGADCWTGKTDATVQKWYIGKEVSLISDLNGTDLSERLNKNIHALRLSKVKDHLHPLTVHRNHECFWQWQGKQSRRHPHLNLPAAGTSTSGTVYR